MTDNCALFQPLPEHIPRDGGGCGGRAGGRATSIRYVNHRNIYIYIYDVNYGTYIRW